MLTIGYYRIDSFPANPPGKVSGRGSIFLSEFTQDWIRYNLKTYIAKFGFITLMSHKFR